jgi:hypothetical protein
MPTKTRLNFACYAAAQASTVDQAALGVWARLTENEPPAFDLDAQCNDPWGLMAGGSGNNGQCIDLARLMRYACGIIGVPASIGYVYATTDNNNFSTNPSAPETRSFEYAPGQHRHEELGYFAGGGLNNWEAVCVVNGHYYAVNETHNSNSVALIKEILCPNDPSDPDDPTYQCWLYYVSVPPPGESGWTCNVQNQYPAPVPGGCP